MYAYKDGVYTNDDCNIHKTVRFKLTDKLQKIVEEYAKNKEKVL